MRISGVLDMKKQNVIKYEMLLSLFPFLIRAFTEHLIPYEFWNLPILLLLFTCNIADFLL